MKNIRNKRKMIEWCQWTVNRGRTVKQIFSGKAKYYPITDLIVTLIGSVLKCAKQLESKTE